MTNRTASECGTLEVIGTATLPHRFQIKRRATVSCERNQFPSSGFHGVFVGRFDGESAAHSGAGLALGVLDRSP